MADRNNSPEASATQRRPSERRTQPESTRGAGDIPLVGSGIAPVAGDDGRPPDSDREPVRGKLDFQKRVTEKVEHSLQEHPDGSAPPLDRLTQDLDPAKDL